MNKKKTCVILSDPEESVDGLRRGEMRESSWYQVIGHPYKHGETTEQVPAALRPLQVRYDEQ